ENTVLLEALAIGAALNVMEAACIATIVPGIDPARTVDLDAERIATALGENLEALLLGWIAPAMLADHASDLRLVAGPRHVCAHRASVGPKKPAVGAQTQAVGAGMRVFEAEALQMHDGIAGGMIGIVLGGIE